VKYIKEYNEYINDNFKKWFGNSKVVDEKGNPIIVYHGTNKDFDDFNSTKFTTSGYFAKDPKLASHISELVGGDSNVVPVYLSIQNPLDLSDITTGYSDISPSELISKLPFELDPHFKEKLLKFHPNPLFTYLGNVDFLEHIKNEGYDGIIFHELTPDQTEIELDNGEVYKTVDIDTGITYIAFKPEQIKSALGNNGNFNPNSKNINENNSIIGWVKTD